MIATREDIKRWLDDGIEMKSTHMIVVCDTFDHSDYPVYVSSDLDVNEVVKMYNNNDMQTIMEVYNFSMDIQKQLDQERVYNI